MSKITVAILKVGAPMETREIEGDLDSMQKIVGGLIEAVHISDDLDMFCNEEGRIMCLPVNFKLGMMPIAGDVFFSRHGEEGEAVSLTEADISYLSTMCRQLRSGMRRAMA